jgi:hypothetical protein
MAEMSIAEALRQAIREEMQRDPRVFVLAAPSPSHWGCPMSLATSVSWTPLSRRLASLASPSVQLWLDCVPSPTSSMGIFCSA